MPGEAHAFEATNVDPGEFVAFYRGSPGSGPCPPPLGGLCLDLRNLQALGTVRADLTGVAVLDDTLPPGAAPGGFYFVQAVVARGPGGADSVKSEVVRATITADFSLPGNCTAPDVCTSGPDADGDGVQDLCDTCPDDAPDDSDGDGVCDTDDVCPGGNDAADGDADGQPNACDACPFDNPDDSDGDGVCESDDPCPLDNPDDSDGDGVCQSDDPCPLDNPDDSDGDGVCESDDPCPLDNPDDSDGDGVCDADDLCVGADATGDADGDAVCDDVDPCPLDNPDDSDGDGICDSTGFRGELTVGPVVFLDHIAQYISLAPLPDGNAAVIYRDEGDATQGKMAVWSPSGVLLQGPSEFEPGINFSSAAPLADGNVAIAYSDYSDGQAGKFVVYDELATEVVAPTTYAAFGNSPSILGMQNGDAFVVWGPSNLSYAIYDALGSEVRASELIDADGGADATLASLPDGSVFVAYAAGDLFDFDSEGRIAVYDADGELTVAPFRFDDVTTGTGVEALSATTMTDGNVLIAYRDRFHDGVFVIYSATGVELVPPTVFHSDFTSDIDATALHDGSVLIAYKDGDDGNQAKYLVVDAAGTTLVESTVFEDSGTYTQISAITLAGGQAMIAYSDLGDDYRGKFVIVE